MQHLEKDNKKNKNVLTLVLKKNTIMPKNANHPYL